MRDIDEGLTLSRVADRAEIEELVAAYSHRLDDRDWAGWAELFTEDGCYQSRVGPAFKGDLAGVAERNLGALEGSHHMLGQHSITLDGDEARGRCYYIGTHVRHAAHPSQCDVVAGWYHPRRTEPHVFDLDRRVAGKHLAFGTADHNCIGQMLARLESECLVGSMLRHCETLQPTSTATYRTINQMRMIDTLPIRLG